MPARKLTFASVGATPSTLSNDFLASSNLLPLSASTRSRYSSAASKVGALELGACDMLGVPLLLAFTAELVTRRPTREAASIARMASLRFVRDARNISIPGAQQSHLPRLGRVLPLAR